MTKLDRILKSRHITLLIKICLAKVMFFSSSHVWMWLLDYKESWVLKNWCFWTVVLEKTFESPLDNKTQPVHPKGNESWYSLEGLMLKLQYFGHLMQRIDLLRKTLMLGKIEGRGEGDDRGWEGLMDGITDSMGWVWAIFWSWRWIGNYLQIIETVHEAQY